MRKLTRLLILFLVAASSVAMIPGVATSADSRITALYLGRNLGLGIGKFADSYLSLHQTRANWDARIQQLEKELAACDGCAKKQDIEAEIRYWKRTKNNFKIITTDVIDAIGRTKIFKDGDPKWAAAWKRILGLDDGLSKEERAQRHYKRVAAMPPLEYEAYLYSTRRIKICIPIMVSARRCKMNLPDSSDPFHETDCALIGLARAYCDHATHLAFQEKRKPSKKELANYRRAIAVLLERRRTNEVIPVVASNDYGYEVSYGTVPESFTPKMPSIDDLSGDFNRLIISMNYNDGDPGWLTSIWLSREDRSKPWMMGCKYGRSYVVGQGQYSTGKTCPKTI